MFRHNKTAAFVLSLALCISAAAPVCSVYAEGESTSAEDAVVMTADEEAQEETSEETEDLLSEGDFKYSLTDDDTVCIEKYIGSETAVTIPGSLAGKTVTEIGSRLFEEFADAVSVHIPASVEDIGECFSRCEKLTAITADEANEIYYAKDGILYKSREDGDWLVCYPQSKEGTSFAVPENVVLLAEASIYNTKLEEITFHSAVKSLSRHCLSYNEKLTAVDLGGTAVERLGEMTFAGCIGLTDVTFPEGLTEIGGASFAGCDRLAEIEFPETLTIIGQNAFAGTALKIVTVPAGVTEIGYCAFGYNENLEPLDDFTVIGTPGSAAQVYCTDSDEDYGYANEFTFVDVADSELVLESMGLEFIPFGDYTYAVKDGEVIISACVSMESVIEVPAEIEGMPVTRIYGGTFFKNEATEIILPDSIKQIDEISISMCPNLKTLKLPANLETIKNQAFADCTALETIEIPASCMSIGEEAFLGCTALKEINVTGEGGAYISENGVLYNADKSVIVAYPAAKEDKSYKAPDSAKEILLSAFFGNPYLEEVDISSVEAIGAYAFESCGALNYVKLSKNLEKIGTCAFYNCNSLKSLRTYDKITEVGTAAIGFYFDEADTENSGNVMIDGFTLYAEEDSGGARYALVTGIECRHDTIGLFGLNIQKGFLYVVCAIVGASILALIGFFTGKALKKKKEEKAVIERKSQKNKVKEDSGNEDK